MPQEKVNDIVMHYQQAGTGPDVILVHAFTSNSAVWLLTNIVGALAEDYRVTMYDLRGHGLSQATPQGYTSDDLSNDLIALMDHLQIEEALLVGHSLGGVIATHAAIQAPNRIQGVVVSDSYFPCLAELEPEMPHAAPWRDLRASFDRAGISLSESVNFAELFHVVNGLTSDQREVLDQALGPAGARWLSQMGKLATTNAGDEAFRVAGLTKQALLKVQQPLVALYDEHTPFAATRDFLGNQLENCTVDVVPEAKHLAPVENSAEFIAIVQQHLNRIAGRGVST